MRAWYLGAGMDPLTLTLEFLTAVVVEAPAYDRLFRAAVDRNDEGFIAAAGRTKAGLTGFRFDTQEVESLTRQGKLSAVADACLHLALRHRAMLLGGK
jgi:hypothetical protein